MKENFDELKIGDKIYVLSIRDSNLYEFPRGRAFRELKVEAIVRYPTNIYLQLSDSITTICPPKTMDHHVSYRGDDDILLSVDIYGVSKKVCVDSAARIIGYRRGELGKIRERLQTSDNDLMVTAEEIENLDVTEKQEEPSLEEFATMALE